MLNIVRATGAPLPVRIGSRTILISPPSLRMRGMLLAWLANRPEVRADFEKSVGSGPPSAWLPRITSEIAIKSLLEDGGSLLLYATTRADHPGLTIDECEDLARLVDLHENEFRAISEIATLGMLARDLPEILSVDRESTPRRPEGYPGLESTDFGMLLESPSLRKFAPDHVSSLTLDQAENALRGGKWAAKFGVTGGRPVSMDETIAHFRECLKAQSEGREMPEWQ